MTQDDDEEIIAAARAGFLDEALEMLAQFEQSLLVMESHPEDRENLNAAFRAAHTIKGSAGLFGFDAVVAFTHEAETLLEALRSGELGVSEPVAAALLRSRDQMEHLLDEVRTGQTDPALAERSARLGAELRALQGKGAPPAAAGPAPAAAVAHAAAGACADDAVPLWQLSLRFGRDALRNGLDPLSFIRYLDTLGQVLAIHTLAEQVPTLELLDPEGCCLGFEVRLASSADRATIADVFSFCIDDCEIAILGADATPADWQALLERRAGDETQRASLLALWRSQGVVLPLRDQANAATSEADAAEDPEVAGSQSAAPQIERRAEAAAPDRRQAEPERRAGSKDRRAADETRFIRVRADKLDRLIDLIGELVIAGRRVPAHHGWTMTYPFNMLGALPVRGGATQLQRMIEQAMRDAGRLSELEPGRISFGGLSPLEVRGQCSMIVAYVRDHLAAHESAAVHARYAYQAEKAAGVDDRHGRTGSRKQLAELRRRVGPRIGKHRGQRTPTPGRTGNFDVTEGA